MARTIAGFRYGLVKNGGFELGTGSQVGTGWIGSEWYWWIVDDATGTGSFDNTTSHSGTQCLKALKSAVAGSLSIANVNSHDLSTLTVHGIKVNPLTSYTFSYWYKTDGITAPRVGIHEYTASAWIQSPVNSVLLSTPTVWTQYTATFTTSATTVNLAIVPCLYNSEEGANGTYAYFDDIGLQQTSRTAASARSAASARNEAV